MATVNQPRTAVDGMYWHFSAKESTVVGQGVEILPIELLFTIIMDTGQ